MKDVIVRMDVAAPRTWSAVEVARRWTAMYPKKFLPDGTAQALGEAEIAALAKDSFTVAKWRTLLADLSWFMKALKEPISRKANREEDCRNLLGGALLMKDSG
ncbi:MAG: hypothetical protein LUO89_12465 [Methanothrix sp.]|nr:hypothetical protein [Methanothrix sp.]